MMLLLAACHDFSQVGQLTQPTPTAVVATVAQPFTTDSSGVLHTTVRAGADVVLTGTSSHKGENNTGVPIISYTWQQLNPGADAVDLIQRTPDTVSFRAPPVTSETALTFQLSVADSNGATSSANAVVTVEPIRDPDHFLEFVAVRETFAVTAVTSASVPATVGAVYSATLPFTVTVTKLVSFTDINGLQRSMVPVGKSVVYPGGWSSALGSGGTNCVDARNPQLRIPTPKLNLDDELADGSGRLSDVLETSDVDLDPANASIPPALVYAKIEIQSAALPSGVSPQICVTETQGVSAPPTIVTGAAVTATSEQLKAPSSNSAPYDSSASAHAYYATIDPTGSKGSLTSWLSANGFSPNASGWGADAHAVYTNNYDLGFGRDMYMKFGACDGDAASLPLQQRIGKCDVASVVINYLSVQAAANKFNPIVAVAMEYNAAPATSPGSQRFVKFYIFAPDTRTGAFQRVTSVDLDHRGQKPVPQSCIVCHGGTPAVFPGPTGGTEYPNHGNVAAGFLSWDLDSFYFSDTDPGFSTRVSDAALRAQYTRAKQEAQFKLLNSGTYLTLDDPNRFALERELLEGWYGGAGLPSSFNGAFVPPDWQPGGVNQNPSDSAALYSNVFARQCRACHVLQAPALDTAGQYVDPRTVTQTPGSSIQSCSYLSTSPVTPTPVGANQPHQIPMGCYWEFAHAPFVSGGLRSGFMPFARRTMDQLWVQPDGSASAGAALQNHFAAQTPAVTVSTPGTSIAVITTPNPATSFSQITAAAQDDSTLGAPADIGNAVRLDSSRSAFPDTISWQVSACTGTPASPGQCVRNLPVVGSANTVAWFLLDDTVTYQVSLKLDGGQGLATSAPYYYQVVEVDPTFVSPAPVITVPVGGQSTVLPASIFQLGNGGAARNLVLLQPGSGLAITPTACTVAPGCTAAAIAAGFIVQSTGGAPSTSAVTVTVRGAGSSPKEVVTESVPVNVTP
jgi:hypothetical protein